MSKYSLAAEVNIEVYVCAVLEVPDVGVNKKADNDMRIRLPLHCGFLPQEGVDIISSFAL